MFEQSVKLILRFSLVTSLLALFVLHLLDQLLVLVGVARFALLLFVVYFLITLFQNALYLLARVQLYCIGLRLRFRHNSLECSQFLVYTLLLSPAYTLRLQLSQGIHVVDILYGLFLWHIYSMCRTQLYSVSVLIILSCALKSSAFLSCLLFLFHR